MGDKGCDFVEDVKPRTGMATKKSPEVLPAIQNNIGLRAGMPTSSEHTQGSKAASSSAQMPSQSATQEEDDEDDNYHESFDEDDDISVPESIPEDSMDGSGSGAWANPDDA